MKNKKFKIFLLFVIIIAGIFLLNSKDTVISGISIPKGYKKKEVISNFETRDGISYSKYIYGRDIESEIREEDINYKGDEKLSLFKEYDYLASRLINFTAYTPDEEKIIETLSKKIKDNKDNTIYLYEDETLIKFFLYDKDERSVNIVLIHK